MRFSILLVSATLMMLHPFAAAAVAQDGKKPAPGGSDPCQVMPNSGHDTQTRRDDKDLARCNGVLKPPPGTDEQMEKRPPKTGDMPVIRPENLPPEQKPQ